MAESFLFSIAESLISKLASRAYEEASQVLGVYDTLKEFNNTLSLIKAVLLDAEQKQEQNHELKQWLRQIKHVFYDAENVFDEFECETLRKQVINTHGSTKAKVSHFFSSSNPLVFRYKMANQIKEINKRLDKVAADRHKFGLQIIEVDRRVVHGREMTYSSVNNSDVIGRDFDREKIIELLMQQNANNEDKSLSVIPIVGIGGLGKTTLAKFVFNDNRIQEHFAPKMWVCVSDNFEIKQLLLKIINSANDSSSNGDPVHQQNFKDLDIQQLQNYLKNKLAGQKFLLVLDDVWNEDRVKWVELRDLIQVGAEGSKILVTTRSNSIASMMGTVPSHSLEGLSLYDSLSLFIKWAFKEGEENKYPHLVNIGRDIVKKCGGVPLAVRTLGSLLFSKFNVVEWENVRDNEIWNLPQKKDDILPALKLSYDLMPSYLRQCFALFSLYPKDYRFENNEITSLWRANGLLSSSKINGTLEDVANQYLHELQSRSFLQDFASLSTFYYFEIHDLVHDLALFVAKDECLHINSCNQNISENAQHLYFEENALLGQPSTSRSMGVRTVRFLGAQDGVLLDTWLSKYKYLRYLDLRSSTFENLPRSISKLKHLRYFNVSNNENIKRLPDSICKLQNLQCLIFYGCPKLETLPKGLRKLISLRQLEITTKQSFFPDNEIAELNSLEHLCIESCENLESVLQGVKLPTLKSFELSGCQRLKNFQLDVKCFPELETLLIGECEDLNFLSKGQDEQGRKLKLKSVGFWSLEKLVTLPQWVQEASQTLHSLTIAECNQLEVLPEWFSTLTNLKIINIMNCRKLLALPDNIHRLTALESLVITDCPELYKKYKPQVGEYWPQISHIKHVSIGSMEEED